MDDTAYSFLRCTFVSEQFKLTGQQLYCTMHAGVEPAAVDQFADVIHEAELKCPLKNIVSAFGFRLDDSQKLSYFRKGCDPQRMGLPAPQFSPEEEQQIKRLLLADRFLRLLFISPPDLQMALWRAPPATDAGVTAAAPKKARRLKRSGNRTAQLASQP